MGFVLASQPNRAHSKFLERFCLLFSAQEHIRFSLYLVVYSLYFSLISSNFQLVTSLIYMYI